ncbi:MAG: succinate dehydrogenase [Phycisphaerae bacterium]|nr:succinate dehydrogenase [Phycisphaerae bacterium]
MPAARQLGSTTRTDRWWVVPAATFAGLLAFIVYSTWAAFQGRDFCAHAGAPTVSMFGGAHSVASYLSPMYSPVLFDVPGTHSGHAWFGEAPGWLTGLFPAFVGFSPAFLILWAPGGFRFTCYYYRGAYYKAFWGDPLSCAVGEPGFRGRAYRGEQKFPLILQNIHRYFLYLAVAFIGLLTYDAVISYVFRDPATGAKGFGIGLGSLVLTINPILLGGYTFGCHSLRHLIAGRIDCMSEHPARFRAYEGVSCLNRNHMKWAWASLFWVGFTDFYVRMVATGAWTDWRIV